MYCWLCLFFISYGTLWAVCSPRKHIHLFSLFPCLLLPPPWVTQLLNTEVSRGKAERTGWSSAEWAASELPCHCLLAQRHRSCDNQRCWCVYWGNNSQATVSASPIAVCYLICCCFHLICGVIKTVTSLWATDLSFTPWLCGRLHGTQGCVDTGGRPRTGLLSCFLVDYQGHQSLSQIYSFFSGQEEAEHSSCLSSLLLYKNDTSQSEAEYGYVMHNNRDTAPWLQLSISSLVSISTPS